MTHFIFWFGSLLRFGPFPYSYFYFSPSAHSFLKDCALEIFQYFLFFLPLMLPTAYYKDILLVFRSVSASLDGSIYPAGGGRDSFLHQSTPAISAFFASLAIFLIEVRVEIGPIFLMEQSLELLPDPPSGGTTQAVVSVRSEFDVLLGKPPAYHIRLLAFLHLKKGRRTQENIISFALFPP